jgi:hypothetical protein
MNDIFTEPGVVFEANVGQHPRHGAAGINITYHKS